MRVGISCAGVALTATGAFVRQSAQAAERAGFSAFWAAEHVVLFGAYPASKYPYAAISGTDVPIPDPRMPIADPVVTMIWAAAATTKIEVGSGILILPQRNPVVLAKELATLDEYCGGRVVLGVGVGWCKEEYDACNADWEGRGRRTDEHIDVLRALWRNDMSRFSGETIAFDDAYCYPKPVRNKDIPILIGGESDAALKRVARAGDGWYAFNLPVDDARSRVLRLKQLTAEQGRDPECLRIVATVFADTSMAVLERYREAGITEFNLLAVGVLPLDGPGLADGIEELGRRFVAPLADW
ncbi:MAG: TIGR03619 family F420-dependent LLM class oxidoreductase [Georgfuchsia sp.]